MQKTILKNNLIYSIIFFFLVSCSSVPKYPQNACKIFGEKYFYLKYTRAASKKWGVPISSILAVINKESGFRRFAKPKRTKLFKIIPYRRPSSSLGFSQAVVKTFDLYKKENKLKLQQSIFLDKINIGIHIGGRDHSTVIHACKNIDKKAIADSEFQRKIDSMKSEISGQKLSKTMKGNA